MDDATFARLTALERAEFLHASTLRRQGDMLDQHEARMARLEQLIADQQRMQHQLLDVSAKLQTTLEAIKDVLERGRNGQ